MSEDSQIRKAYRCVVAPENSAAMLRAGSKSVQVSVLDTSCEAFTVRISSRDWEKLKKSRILQLRFAGEFWEVARTGAYTECAQFTQLTLGRIRELTKIKQPSGFSFAITPRFSGQKDPTLLLGLLVAFLLVCICLPGIGDQIGTAPKVSRTVRSVWNSVIP